MRRLSAALLVVLLAGCGGEAPEGRETPLEREVRLAREAGANGEVRDDMPTATQKVAIQATYDISTPQRFRGLDPADSLSANGHFIEYLRAQAGSREEREHWRDYRMLVEAGEQRALEKLAEDQRAAAELEAAQNRDAAAFAALCERYETLPKGGQYAMTPRLADVAPIREGLSRLTPPATANCLVDVEAGYYAALDAER